MKGIEHTYCLRKIYGKLLSVQRAKGDVEFEN